ncbi:hypothetical protein KAYACHO_79 [Mycobacterium phage KayaCho]|uniref:hypothetical protein n=1 Tax=Mycobacterium phage KayaCho TaxID=1340830 RepID=UPI000387F8F5|nr:hypothetical protein N846_gp79 [Mycobacterium phage KayaCho]AGT12983.1 hypothetical protein KAYACHO_79 [Mycobacterium phage KayaCho]
MTRPGRVCRCGHAWTDHQLAGDLTVVCDRCDEVGGCDNDSAYSVPDVLEMDAPDWYRPNGQGDGLRLRDIELAPSESICAECRLVHRPGTECP